LDADGITNSGAKITLQPKTHTASFFAGLFPGLGNIQGSLAFSGVASPGISAVVMRSNGDPIGMTSLPVLQGAAKGFSYPTTGTAPARTGIVVPNVNVTGNTDIKSTAVPWGLKLATTITGFPTTGSGPQSLQAVSASGKVYRYYTTPSATATTTIYLAPGVYTLRTTGYLGTSTSSGGTWVTYTNPDPVVVTADNTATVAVPTPSFYTITGTIAGIDKISSATGTSLVFVSTDTPNLVYTVYCSQTNGSFTQQFPAGTYTAAIRANGFGSSTSAVENMTFYNIGKFTVSSDASVSLTLPDTAVLSGAATFAGTTPATFAVNAADASAPSAAFDPRNYLTNTGTTSPIGPNLATSVWTSPSGYSGAYGTQLVNGHPYNMNLTWSVYEATATTIVGQANYTPTSNQTTLNGNGTYNFGTVPALPDMVTLSGKVTQLDGTTGIQSAVVIVISTEVTGAPGITYRAQTSSSAASGQTGNWSVTVPKGKYKVYVGSGVMPFAVPAFF